MSKPNIFWDLLVVLEYYLLPGSLKRRGEMIKNFPLEKEHFCSPDQMCLFFQKEYFPDLISKDASPRKMFIHRSSRSLVSEMFIPRSSRWSSCNIFIPYCSRCLTMRDIYSSSPRCFSMWDVYQSLFEMPRYAGYLFPCLIDTYSWLREMIIFASHYHRA